MVAQEGPSFAGAGRAAGPVRLMREKPRDAKEVVGGANEVSSQSAAIDFATPSFESEASSCSVYRTTTHSTAPRPPSPRSGPPFTVVPPSRSEGG